LNRKEQMRLVVLNQVERGKGGQARIWETLDYPCGQRLKSLIEMELGQIRDEVKNIYLRLNPAELKRSSDAKLARLYETYAMKGKT